jgi:ribonucleoside-diphosphate reductase alpha chain
MSTFENTSEMYVTKRNGNKEIISFDKILQRIKKTGKDANIKINYTSLVIKIIDQLFDGIPTDKIDEISAEQCATMSSIHYDYGTLASRLIISNHHKNTSISFSKTMKRLYTEQMLSDVFMQNVNANAKQLDTLIDYNRDYLIDYFGFKTLERSYLMSIKKRVQERPQMMFLRLAVAIHGTDFQKIQETYHALSNKQMIHGTPSLYNAGTRREQMSSCFLRNTSVHTIGGPVPIQDVKEGYKVVTHTGEVQTVTQIHTNCLGNRKLYTVQFHRTRSFVVTEDHPLYVYDKLNETIVWKTVEELTKDDYVMIPKNKLHKYELNQEHDVSKLVVDSDIQKFFGIWHRYGEFLYYADTSGQRAFAKRSLQQLTSEDASHSEPAERVPSCLADPEKSGGTITEPVGIQIVLPTDCLEAITFCFKMKQFFGGVRLEQAEYDNGVTVLRYELKQMATDFISWFGLEKRIPQSMYQYPTHWVRAFLSGWNVTECPLMEGQVPDTIYTLCRINHLDHITFLPLNYVECDEIIEHEDNLFVQFLNKDEYSGDLDFSGNMAPVHSETPVYTLGVENDHSYSVAGVVAKNCYLIAMESDSIDGIYNTLKDCALISKYAGGIGLHIHNIRATGSHIAGTNGTSNGIVPMLRVFNNTAKYVDQCLHPLSTIYTTQGPMNIRNVIQGETEIYNQLGETEIVQNVLEHSYDGPMLHIQSEFSMDDLNITPEHPVFVLRGNGTEPHSNYTLKQMLEKQMLEPIWIEAGELDTTDLLAFPIPNYEKDVSNIHEEDCYLYGLLLCDGEFNDERGAFCTLTTHTPYTYEFVCGYLKLHCVDYSITKHEDVYTFVWKRPAHLPFRYRDLSGFIANRWLNLPIQKSQFILKGMMDSQHGTIGKQIQLQHMSKQIIECCRFLCLKMGILTHVRCSSSGYYLTIPVTQETCELFHLEYDGRESPFVRHENFLFSPIRYILSNEYKGVLYDLQMEKQHDYLLSNALVHNGGGKRNGSIAIYLEPWHADIELFLQLRKNHGEEELKARDLFYALWIPDLFMKRVKEAGKWTLFCPHECPGLADVHNEAFETLYTTYEESGKGKATLNARDLWFKILDAQMETGTPYLIYKDAANRKSNQQNLGTIKSSNLCVAPETLILTDEGHIPIQKLHGKHVNVWNGNEFSEVEIVQTGKMQKLIEVHTSDLSVLHCTPYHKFYIKNGYGNSPVQIIEADKLCAGDKILKCEYPCIDGKKEMNYAYTHGFFCGDGTYTNNNHQELSKKCSYKCVEGHFYCNRHINYETENNIERMKVDETLDKLQCNATCYEKKPTIFLYDEKKDLLPYMDYIGENTENNGRIFIRLPLDIEEKYNVPLNHTLKCKMEWFSGYCDADGTIANNKTNQQLQICSINKTFFSDIKYMLQTCGINPKFSMSRNKGISILPDGHGSVREFQTQPLYRILITSFDLKKLIALGFSPKRLKLHDENLPNRSASQYIKIKEIIDKGRYDDTYCFTEPKKHAGIFNGIYTSQCAEIIEYSDEHETAVCNLCSIALPAFVVTDPSGVNPPTYDFEKLHQISRMATYNLNRVIDINYYPTEKTRRSNMRHRPIGIGVQGLADTFMMMGYTFGSPESRRLNQEIFETMYHGALVESCEIAQKEGAYETFEGSPASKGQLQFDLWDFTDPLHEDPNDPQSPHRYDWTSLKIQIQTYGLRNSLLLAPMPTASTSQILGYNECIEPITSNIYARRTLAGEFIITNKYLMKDLISLGLWNEKIKNNIVANFGSIQNIDIIPVEIREKYKTVWEIPMRTLIDMAAERGVYVDQSQSLNLWLEEPTYSTLTSMHFYSWSKGLKTGIYYLRRRARHAAQQFTIEPEKAQTHQEDEEEICEMCSG